MASEHLNLLIKKSGIIVATLSVLLGSSGFSAPDDIAPGMFTEEEILQHRENIDQITSVAADCLYQTALEQREFFKKYGVTKFYGDRNPKYNTLAKRREVLKNLGKNPDLANQQESISCIGLTRKCLSKGFAEAKLSATWSKIDRRLAKDQNYDGTDLQKMLRLLGWEVLYWNPDPSQNEAWDEEDRSITPLAEGRRWMPVWGGHAYNYSMVKNRGTYYGVPVDDAETLVGFGDQAPPEFAKADFFVGTAHAGYHVFPGYSGYVVEGHSMRSLDSIDNIQVSQFNPLASGGGPRWTRSERYRSGIIAIPPKSIEKKP